MHRTICYRVLWLVNPVTYIKSSSEESRGNWGFEVRDSSKVMELELEISTFYLFGVLCAVSLRILATIKKESWFPGYFC